jgi:hypothetical protein
MFNYSSIKIQFGSWMGIWPFAPPVSNEGHWVISTFFLHSCPSFFGSLELSKSFYIQTSCLRRQGKENHSCNIGALGPTCRSLLLQSFWKHNLLSLTDSDANDKPLR